MKKIQLKSIALTFIATSAFYAAVAFILVYTGAFLVLSHGQAQEIVDVFNTQQEMLHKVYSALMLCKSST